MSREKETETDGLCATCINVATCVYCLIRGGNVVYCDMFDDGSGKIRSGDVSRGTREKTTTASDCEECQTFEGLCFNCSLRYSCTKSRPLGGVWHCEDYS